MKHNHWLWCSLISAGLFLASAKLTVRSGQPEAPSVEDRIVLAAPLQVLLSGGDRYLAANLEAIRSAASGPDSGGEDDVLYRIRSHGVVAELNPCHEDNYYLGNALLTWGGAVRTGNELLRRAMNCRNWDEFPAFFYGLNEYFFLRNYAEARRALEVAAERSTVNAASYAKIAIMIGAEALPDERVALDYLEHERDSARDPKLREMLDKRVMRLEGLIALRDAQRRFEKQLERPLESPEELIRHGFLAQFPDDPLRLGYEFINGEFRLRKLKVLGMEEQQ